MPETDTDQLVKTLIESPENHCFVCSPTNPLGLRLRFERDGEAVRAEFVPGHWHVGWAGVVHGGILSSVLDEAMAYCLFFAGLKGVTARMHIRYRAPVRQSDHLLVKAEIKRDTRRLADIEACILRDGQVVAEGAGCFMKLGKLDRDSLRL